jgi:hypothetical protein
MVVIFFTWNGEHCLFGIGEADGSELGVSKVDESPKIRPGTSRSVEASRLGDRSEENCKSSFNNDNYLFRIINEISLQRGRFFKFFLNVSIFKREWINIVLIYLLLETIYIILKTIFCFRLDFDRNTSLRALHKFITIFLFYQETSHLVLVTFFSVLTKYLLHLESGNA